MIKVRGYYEKNILATNENSFNNRRKNIDRDCIEESGKIVKLSRRTL